MIKKTIILGLFIIFMSAALAPAQDSTDSLKEKAAKGDLEAQYELGLAYYGDTDPDRPQNLGEAEKWFKKAALKGHAGAQYFLGEIYFNNPDIKNKAEALAWYTKSAQQQGGLAQLKLVLIYLNGLSGPEDPAKAFELAKPLAESGLFDAPLLIGLMYDEGLGTAKNETEARKWYKAALQKHGYEEKNYPEALEFFTTEAESEEGENNNLLLGIMYEKGLGTAPAKEKADHYYRLALDKGDLSARHKMKKQESNLRLHFFWEP